MALPGWGSWRGFLVRSGERTLVRQDTDLLKVYQAVHFSDACIILRKRTWRNYTSLWGRGQVLPASGELSVPILSHFPFISLGPPGWPLCICLLMSIVCPLSHSCCHITQKNTEWREEAQPSGIEECGTQTDLSLKLTPGPLHMLFPYLKHLSWCPHSFSFLDPFRSLPKVALLRSPSLCKITLLFILQHLSFLFLFFFPSDALCICLLIYFPFLCLLP